MADLSELQSSLSVKLSGASASGGIENFWVNVDSAGSLQVAGEGIAGTPAGGVVTVQGIAGGTAIPASQSGTWTVQPGNTQNTTAWLTQDAADGPVTPGTVATKSMLIGGQYNSTLPTLTTGQQSAIQVDSSGRLLVSGVTSTGVADKTTFTYGTTTFTDIGGVFQDTSPTLTAGQSGSVRLTANRAFHVNLRDASGNEKLAQQTSALSVPVVIASDQSAIPVTQSTSPWVTKDQSDGPVTPGTVASFSQLAGGQFNTTLPTLTTGQQSSIQLDSSGRIIVRNSEFPATVDTNYGTVGASTLRIAAQIGNATGGADFNAGNTSAQTLRVVVATNQAAIPVSQSGTWTVQQGTPPWTVQGDSASGASKAGNPVQIGGVFNTTQPTVTTGQTVEAQSTARGALIVATGTDVFNVTTQSDGPVTPGTVAAKSSLSGGQYNSTLPTLTTGQQAALQLSSRGQLLVQGTIQPLYGSNNQALTITLASLANASARGCTAVNNSTALFEDVLIFVKITTGATITSTGYINIYAYGSVDGGTTYSESFGGTDASITLASPPNAVLIAQINANVASTTYRAGPFSYCRTVGMDRLPQYWGVFVVNQSGGTLGATATTQAVTYQGVNGQF